MVNDRLKTVIEITPRHIKCVQAKLQRNTAVLTGVIVHAINGELKDNLQSVLSKVMLNAPGPLLVVSRRQVLLKQMLLPSVDPREIKKMLELKIPQQVPYDREEVAFDYHILEHNNPKGYARILFTVTPDERIRAYLAPLEDAKIHAQAIAISSLGIIEWFYHITPKQQGPAAVLNLDEDSAELCFCANGKFLFSRHINLGINDLNESPSDEVINQIGLTMGAFRSECPGNILEHIYILSDDPRAFTLQKSLEEYYQLPVAVLKVPGLLPCENSSLLTTIQNNPTVSLSACLGFVLGKPAYPLDLLPQNRKETDKKQSYQISIVRLVINALIVLVLTAGVLAIGPYKKYLYLCQLQTTLSEHQSARRKARQKIDYANTLDHTVKNNVLASSILSALYGAVTPDISLQRLDFNNSTLSIEGLAKDTDTLKNFKDKLSQSPLFHDVVLEKASVNFKLTLHMATTGVNP